MTPEERARQCWREMSYDDYGNINPDWAIEYIADAIRDAVAEERKTCARLPDALFPNGPPAHVVLVGAEPVRSEDEAKNSVDVRMTAYP